MAETYPDPVLSGVRQLRHRHILDRLDYLRGLRRLADGMTQTDLARALGLTQPSISSALKSAAKVADLRPGFSGAGPYEIAQRYVAGELDRDQLIDELARWVPDPTVRAVDNPADPNSEMRKAVRDGLLDEDAYRMVLARQLELSSGSTSERAGPASA
ncbi:MarR family transcriptional regulator [Microlunatus soli]|uniref:HTH cro/C1-type domain-containing protein n=1 Tax=Microlunatus soli TaxID=630515 RepID=A0A1H1UH81_9ACTN|nr:MarR family transcriptional regulator [Microlunatus soli]SDS71865.1 hypothetical protein SAMN04489812_2788 [Microlunatus soli]